MINSLMYTDCGKWVVFTDGEGNKETGRIKSYDNVSKTAWVVYKADGHLGKDDHSWKDYTSAKTNYSNLAFIEPSEEDMKK